MHTHIHTHSFGHPASRPEPPPAGSLRQNQGDAQSDDPNAPPGQQQSEWHYAETDFPAMPGAPDPAENRGTEFDERSGGSVDVNDDELCGICYEGRADASLMPCAHKFCSSCIARLKKRAVCSAVEGVLCPNCRAPVQQFVLPEDAVASPSIPVWGTPSKSGKSGGTPSGGVSDANSSGSMLMWGSANEGAQGQSDGVPRAAGDAKYLHDDAGIVVKVRLADKDINLSMRWACVVCMYVCV
jgi:hypothetical protein